MESDSENHLEPLLHIKTEIIEMSSSETNCKELPEKKKRQPRKTARRSKKITNDIKMNNSEKLNHIENDNNSENVSYIIYGNSIWLFTIFNMIFVYSTDV